MITGDWLVKLQAIEGLIFEDEGQKLAELAGQVPKDQWIVEVGSHRGQSSSWLAVGAHLGNGARLACVDIWADQTDTLDEYFPQNRDAFAAFEAALTSVGMLDSVTSIHSEAETAAREWTGNVGMFFHDADHAYEAVAGDFLAWQPHLAPESIYACHDYWENLWQNEQWVRTKKHQMAIEEKILPTGSWTDIEITNSLWTGRRQA